VANATSCSGAGYNWAGLKSVSGGNDNLAGNASSTYTITCTGPGGTGSDSVTVNVVGAPTPNLRVNGSDGPLTVDRNTNLNITYGAVPNAVSCSGTGAGWAGSKYTSGANDNIPASSTTTYTLTCTNSVGVSGTDAVTVNVRPAIAGVCGAANGFPSQNPPTVGLCNTGSASAVSPAAAPGPYSWLCYGQNGGANASCSAPYDQPAPIVDLKVNGSDGPLTVVMGANLNLTWGAIPNASSCSGTGASWNGGKSISGGNDNFPASSTTVYTLTCTNSQGKTASDSVSVTLQNTLKLCQSSCSSNIMPPGSFSMTYGETKNLVACWNTSNSCNNSSGNVTSSTSWSEGGGSAVTLSGGDPKVLSATAVGSESISASYSGNTVNHSVTVTCIPQSCSNDTRYDQFCADETYTMDSGCGYPQTCSGSRTCDFNWKEVAPQ
jgi:hypothetical protein